MSPLILAVILGAAFGAVLDRVGATNPNFILGMLRLSNLHLMKAIVLGIATASVLLMLGLSLGVVDAGHLAVKPMYVGVLIGGALLGLGFAIAGYCPGTGWAALATGRRDALWFVLGGIIGGLAHAVSFGWWKNTGLLENLWGGKVTLGVLAGGKFGAVWASLPGEAVGLAVAGIMLIVVALLPQSFRK